MKEAGQEWRDMALACLELANSTQEGHYEPAEHEICDVIHSLQAMFVGAGEYSGGGKDGRNKE